MRLTAERNGAGSCKAGGKLVGSGIPTHYAEGGDNTLYDAIRPRQEAACEVSSVRGAPAATHSVLSFNFPTHA